MRLDEGFVVSVTHFVCLAPAVVGATKLAISCRGVGFKQLNSCAGWLVAIPKKLLINCGFVGVV
jgi:hypothetical protein